MQILYKLIPPRPTFDQDMSASEREVMERHFAYWEQLTANRIAMVYGPVLDPRGVWGLAILEVQDEHHARAIGMADPAVKSGLCRFEICPMQVALKSEGSAPAAAPAPAATYANMVTTTFRTAGDLEAASGELKGILSEIKKVPGLGAYLLIRTGERQVVSLGAYQSEDAAKDALVALTPLFQPIVTPRVDEPPNFVGGIVLASL